MRTPCPAVSIVIPAYNNWWLTRRCLAHVDALRSQCGVAFETIVVDNGSSDATADELGRLEWVRRIGLERNENFGGGSNAGASAARAPLVLFLNNDAWPLGDALTPLVAAFERPNVAIASGALFYEDGVTQAAGSVLLPDAHWSLSCRNLPAHLPHVRVSRDAVVVPGAAFAVRTQWFLASGGFDGVYRNGFEDADLCMRAHASGMAARYVAESRFAHYEGATLNRFAHEQENERAFYRRWSHALAAIPRVDRGDVGAIIVHRGATDAAADAALRDVLGGVRSFGHPVVSAIAPWRRLDRRFRTGAHLAWNCDGAPFAPSVEVFVRENRAFVRTHGAAALEVPWMPCADPAAGDRDLAGVADAFGYGALLAAYAGTMGEDAAQDAHRRGAPSRSAMRLLDLARAARFGLERPAQAVANAPIAVA